MPRAEPSKTQWLPIGDAGGSVAFSADVPLSVVPVAASALDGISGVAFPYASTDAKGPKCRPAGLSRVAIHAVSIFQHDRTLAPPALPSGIFLELWSVTREAASPMAVVRWAPPTWRSNGFLFQVAGLLTEAFELRAAVDIASPLPAVPREVDFHFTWVVDRVDGGFQVLTGADVTFISSPVVRN